MGSNTGACRACQAPMRWAVNETSGKGVPLNPEPVAEGKLVMVGEEADGRLIVRYVRKGEDTGVMPRYDTHFATCPEADSFRKPDRSKGAR